MAQNAYIEFAAMLQEWQAFKSDNDKKREAVLRAETDLAAFKVLLKKAEVEENALAEKLDKYHKSLDEDDEILGGKPFIFSYKIQKTEQSTLAPWYKRIFKR